MTRRPAATAPRLGALAAGLALAVVPFLAACTPNDPARAEGTGTTLTVRSTADACTLSATRAPAGKLTFTVTNAGDDVTEFYVLAGDGEQVLSEVENIGPGLSRDLVVSLRPGTYVTACKPGMVGDGITHDLTVTGSAAGAGATGDGAARLSAAEAAYVAYVRDEVGTLRAKTEAFAQLYRTGDDDAARAAYSPARVHWERIEPVAESFGDLDPLLDLREADLEAGATWTGWHHIEKDLWPPADGYTPLTPAQRTAAADDLVANTQRLVDAVNADGFTFEAFQISNGAKELLDEVATGKVTGEEEIWSHTDLWDLQANVEGARKAFEVLEDVAAASDPALASTLTQRFDALQALLAEHGSIDAGFAPYTDLTPDQVQTLAAAVDAVSEPLSRLTVTVTEAA